MEREDTHISLWVLITLILLMTIFFLVLLGICKGLLGYFLCAPVGMWGLGMLIDMPQPMKTYQEKHLRDKPVKYDDIGWPVHPETGKRSVRALPRTTEFFLNMIFFLTYPVALMVTICSACWFQEANEVDNRRYRCVNTIVFSERTESMKNMKKNSSKIFYDNSGADTTKSLKVGKSGIQGRRELYCECNAVDGTKKDSKKNANKEKSRGGLYCECNSTNIDKNNEQIYCECDSDEDRDTDYVIYQMHRSQQSLQILSVSEYTPPVKEN